MVHGEPYTGSIDNPDGAFIAELTDILHDLDTLPVEVPSGQVLQISPKMREIRAVPFADRRAIYLTQRIQNQQKWYGDKAAWNKNRADFWMTATVMLEIAGLVGGGIKAAGLLPDVDLLGIFAAAAAGATSWLQAKQHQNLATAYGVTSLAAVASGLEAVADETTWPRFVSDAEEAISREHTLWRTSRGISLKPNYN